MGLFNDILRGAKEIFGDNPGQYVEDVGNGEEMINAATISIKKGDMTKEEAAEALKTRRDADKNADELNKTIEDGIKILPSERLDTVHGKEGVEEPITVKQAEKVERTDKDERGERS